MRVPTNPASSYPINDRVLSLPEAALICGLSVYTLKRCNARGEIKILRLSPRRIGIRLSELQAFLDSRAAGGAG